VSGQDLWGICFALLSSLPPSGGHIFGTKHKFLSRESVLMLGVGVGKTVRVSVHSGEINFTYSSVCYELRL
jgi:hypothetical protein